MTIKNYVALAAIAASVSAGTASAADKLNFGVGGDFYSAFTASSLVGAGPKVDTDGNKTKIDHTNVRQDAYIRFSGDTVLDNGLKVGAKAEFEALTGNDQLHAQDLYVSLANKFGQVIAGRSQTAAAQSHAYIPAVGTAIGFGVDDANLTPYNATGAFLGSADITTDASRQVVGQYAPRISYFTPRLQGLRLGVSYAPQGTTDTGHQAGFTKPRNGGFASNEVSVGGDYNRKLGKVDVTASGGYTFANGNQNVFEVTAPVEKPDTADAVPGVYRNTKRPQAYQAGLSLAYNGFTLGGAYGEARYKAVNDGTEGNYTLVSKNLLRTYGAGLKYETGPWAFGVSGLEQRNTVKFDSEDADPNATKGRERIYEAGVNYILGPGVTTGAGVYYNETLHKKDSVTGAVGVGLHF